MTDWLVMEIICVPVKVRYLHDLQSLLMMLYKNNIKLEC